MGHKNENSPISSAVHRPQRGVGSKGRTRVTGIEKSKKGRINRGRGEGGSRRKKTKQGIARVKDIRASVKRGDREKRPPDPKFADHQIAKARN